MDYLINKNNYMRNKLSVIIPTYNCVEYLNRCIMSVEAANPFEIIIVDDCSTDGTGELCDKFIDEGNITVIHNHDNLGVVVSRNVGLIEAKGEYVTFIDSDDWIEPEFLRRAIDELNIQDSVDIVVGRMLQDNGKGKINYLATVTNEVILNHKEAIGQLFDWRYYRWELCGKVYRRRLFENYRCDGEIRICEDLDSTWQVFRSADKTLCLPIDYYHYFFNEKSASYNTNIIVSNSYKVFEKIMLEGNEELNNSQMLKLKNHYRLCLINLIRELVFQGGDRNLILDVQIKLNSLYRNMKLEQPMAIKRLCHNYHSAIRLIQEIEDEILDLFKVIRPKEKRIYFYGTGIVSDFISRIVFKSDFKDFEYVVSKGEFKRDKFYERKVYYVDQISKNSAIILTVNSNIQNELFHKLIQDGYDNIYKIDTQGVV